MAPAVVEVDVIVPIHDAAKTIRETIGSAMHQLWLDEAQPAPTVYVCCYNDASTDNSYEILQELQNTYLDKVKIVEQEQEKKPAGSENSVPVKLSTHLLIASAPENSRSRGAGYARNRAVNMRKSSASGAKRILCWLDSDDIMHPSRIYHQVTALLQQPKPETTLLGCTFDRIPADATHHYTAWANGLSDERLMLERFREVTLIQPTWAMYRCRFLQLGGYLEAPDSDEVAVDMYPSTRLVHPSETLTTLRVAEDLRFFHEHLQRGGGCLKLCRVDPPLISYRHRVGQSQCSQTPRKLLLQLRVTAFEKAVLNSKDSATSCLWQSFVVWGAGRDGKDFCKALSPALRKRVHCMVDVDDKKIERGFYEYGRCSGKNKDGWKIPVVHFSLAVKDTQVRSELYHAWKTADKSIGISPFFGRIHKGQPSSTDDGIAREETTRIGAPPLAKRPKTVVLEKKDPGATAVNLLQLPILPVVVCVAMYRTNGALESNVKSIGRTEGTDLWHFS